jgi:phosphatidyl-myo-inositol alpha-mannosyltransferase
VKIALVSPYDWHTPGGVNSHVAQLRHEFIERGHETQILAPGSEDAGASGVTILGRPRPVPASGSTARISLNLRLGRQVRELLEAGQYDVVHVHEPLMPVLPIQALRHSRAANPHVINVGTFHATKDGGNRLYSYSRRLLKRWFRELDGKIAVSPPAAAYVGRYFPGFYNNIPNGIDVGRFADEAVGRRPELDDGAVNILYVGRADKRKGLSYLIRAFGMVNARDPLTRLIIVGPNARALRRYRSSVERMGRRGIHFVGRVSDDELASYYRSADILCSPAVGHESQGYVLLEAMAAGVPVVASNIDGYASVVTHRVDGLLTRPKDSFALADALTALVRDPRQRERLAAAGRRRVEAYSWPYVTEQLLAYYERLRDSRGAPEPRPLREAERALAAAVADASARATPPGEPLAAPARRPSGAGR